MIAIDTNILVYAHREDSPWHRKSLAIVTELANSGSPWAITWPSVHEFLAIVTHPKISKVWRFRRGRDITLRARRSADREGAWICPSSAGSIRAGA
jgi:predicted nucleic acid-binding protein